MKDSSGMNFVIGAVAFLPVFLFYGLVIVVRKVRFQTAAEKLRASIVPMGWFSPGKIVGPDFAVEARTIGFGRSKRYFTIVQVPVRDSPGFFRMNVSFFDPFPNWKFGKVLGTKSNRVFGAQIDVSGFMEPTEEQKRSLLKWLEHASLDLHLLHPTLKKNGIKQIDLESAELSTNFRGVISNVERLEGAVRTLRSIAGNSVTSYK